ncbi:MAG: hypothetical protein V3V35_05910 [Dehalococcoidia bacterium]
MYLRGCQPDTPAHAHTNGRAHGNVARDGHGDAADTRSRCRIGTSTHPDRHTAGAIAHRRTPGDPVADSPPHTSSYVDGHPLVDPCADASPNADAHHRTHGNAAAHPTSDTIADACSDPDPGPDPHTDPDPDTDAGPDQSGQPRAPNPIHLVQRPGGPKRPGNRRVSGR